MRNVGQFLKFSTNVEYTGTMLHVTLIFLLLYIDHF